MKKVVCKSTHIDRGDRHSHICRAALAHWQNYSHRERALLVTDWLQPNICDCRKAMSSSRTHSFINSVLLLTHCAFINPTRGCLDELAVFESYWWHQMCFCVHVCRPSVQSLLPLSRLHFFGRHKLSGWRSCAYAINVKLSICSETQNVLWYKCHGLFINSPVVITLKSCL